MKRIVIVSGTAALFLGAMGRFAISPIRHAAAGGASGNPHQLEKEIVPILATHYELPFGPQASRRGEPQYDGLVISNLWLSLMNSMGVSVERHGDSTGRLQ